GCNDSGDRSDESGPGKRFKNLGLNRRHRPSDTCEAGPARPQASIETGEKFILNRDPTTVNENVLLKFAGLWTRNFPGMRMIQSTLPIPAVAPARDRFRPRLRAGSCRGLLAWLVCGLVCQQAL